MTTQVVRDPPGEPLCNLEGRVFDLVIVGAGVAGASAAILAAQRGLSVLLVESQAFPRDKVCGGCLNQRAQGFLERIGLLHPIRAMGAIVIDSLHVQIQSYSSEWKVPLMLSIRRSTLDQMLVDHAIDGGVTFRDGTRARIKAIDSESQKNLRVVVLKNTSAPSETVSVHAKVVVVASGLSRGSLPESEAWPAKVMKGSRVGLHCLIPKDRVPKAFLTRGTGSAQRLYMLVGSSGYLGICETDGGLFDLAAAIDPSAISIAKGISPVVQRLLEECGMENSFAGELNWRSTPHLTRRSECVAKQNLFLLGDATGYVEPFTGEGISWAFKGAEALVPLLYQAKLASDIRTAEKEWTLWITKHRNHRQRMSRWIARQSRNTESAKWVLKACTWLPRIRGQLLRSIMT